MHSTYRVCKRSLYRCLLILLPRCKCLLILTGLLCPFSGGDEWLAGGSSRLRGGTRRDRPLGTDTTDHIVHRRGQPQEGDGGPQGQRAPEVTSHRRGRTQLPPLLSALWAQRHSLFRRGWSPWVHQHCGRTRHDGHWKGGDFSCTPKSGGEIAAPIAISRPLPARHPHPRCWGSIIFMQ